MRMTIVVAFVLAFAAVTNACVDSVDSARISRAPMLTKIFASGRLATESEGLCVS